MKNSPLPILLRAAETRDVPGMAVIRAAVRGTQAGWEETIANYLAGTHHPQRALAERMAFVAVDGDVVVGFIAGHRTQRFGCTGELQWMDVAASHRRQGIAGWLIVALAEWFVEQGAFRVCVDVTAENAAARALYGKFGAQPWKPSWMLWVDIRVALA